MVVKDSVSDAINVNDNKDISVVKAVKGNSFVSHINWLKATSRPNNTAPAAVVVIDSDPIGEHMKKEPWNKH